MKNKFSQRVYALCRQIPKGKISTYGAIARALKSSPRAVGQALKKNPYAPIVPCHRVVKSTGEIGGFMGASKGKSVDKKIKLLRSEGIEIEHGKIKGFKEFLVDKFSPSNKLIIVHR